MTKLKNSNCDNTKNKITKKNLKSNCDKTQKLKL